MKRYWSSSAAPEPTCAYYVVFESTYYMDYFDRNTGFSVRLVTESK